MQKLEKRDTYTPIGAPQADGNCDYMVKHDCEGGQVLYSLKTFSNSSDVDTLREEKQDLRVPVYVLNMRGNPLMPTSARNARILLKKKKAHVIKHMPFTIQLNYATGENLQPIILGIDSGYTFIGFSATTDTREVLSGVVELRKDVSKKLSERKMYRRNRRNKLWYREPRFLNRKREKGWLAPSIQHKVGTHLRLVEKIKGLLPLSTVVMEVANFDTQKMQNPEIKGIEYQQGELSGYEVREYLLEKWGRKCVYCGKGNIPLEIEHIIPKTRGGSNRVSNLTLSCRECNLRKGNKTATEFGYPMLQNQAKKSLKEIAFMTLVKKRIVDLLHCDTIYGFETKHKRIQVGLKKSHLNDAFIIANGGIQERCKAYNVKQIRRNNRAIQLNRKGFKPSIRRKRYGLHPFDLVKCKDHLYRVKGMFNYGTWVRLIDPKENVLNVNVRDVELVQYGEGLQFI